MLEIIPPESFDYPRLQNKPAWLNDNQVSFDEVINKPVEVYNWMIPGGMNLIAENYFNLGSFPYLATNIDNAQGYNIYLIQFVIQWSDAFYHAIVGADIRSFTYWLLPYGEIERSIYCEHHSSTATILTYYLSSGISGRNLLIKLNKNLVVSNEGKINIKIIRLF